MQQGSACEIEGDPRAPALAPALAKALIVGFLCCLGLLGTVRVLGFAESVSQTVSGILFLMALIVLQVAFFGRPHVRFQPRVAWPVIAIQALLVYAPFVVMPWWLGLPGILAGSVLLTGRPAVSIPLFAGIVSSVGFIRSALGDGTFTTVYGAVTTVMTALAVYGLTRLARLVIKLHATGNELARMAVSEQRLEFARNLHDLLGVRLSAIAAKAVRTRKLLRERDPKLDEEMEEILAVSRSALRDTRSMASGYRHMTLESELRSARIALESAGVRLQIARRVGELSPAVSTTLALAVCEGTTNLLRHSDAHRCEIRIDEVGAAVRLTMSNDGVADAAWGRATGTGFDSLSDRVERLDGNVHMGKESDGRFRLLVSLPRDAAGTGLDNGDPGELRDDLRLPVPSSRLAYGVVAGVFACFGAIALADMMLVSPDSGEAALGVGYLFAILALQLGYFSRPRARFKPMVSVPLLVLQACLVLAPVLQFGAWWLSLPGFVAGSALLVLRPRAAIPVNVAAVAGVVGLTSTLRTDPLHIAADGLTVVATSLVVYGLTNLVRLAREQHTTRRKLARIAITEERLRFAQDLHDLLGLSLSAITLKTELTARLMSRSPEQAEEHLREIGIVARKTLVDARSVAAGYQELSLEEELASARSVLRSATMEVRIECDDPEVPPTLGPLLATVVREGATNVLRHSKAEWCEIVVRRDGDMLRLEIVNDGVTGEPGEARDPLGVGGAGIRNITDRLNAVNGTVSVTFEDGGVYRLTARVPCRAAVDGH